MSSFANTFHQQLLIDGYVRKETDKLISVDILNVIMLFCNEAFKWSFKGSEWTEFLNAKNGKAIYGPLFNINDIIFKCSVCPNGFKTSEKNQVKFWLEIEYIPINILTVWVYYEIYCKETESSWKDCLRITQNSNGNGTAWKQKLKLSKCKSLNLKTITFYYFLEIIKIEYLEQQQIRLKQRTYTPNIINISDKYEYEWIVGKIISNENKIYLSRNFDNGCWYSFCDLVYIDKYAITDALLTKFNVGLKLVRLPLDIEKISVRYCIICDYQKVKGTRSLSLRELKTRQIMHSFQLKSKRVYQYLPIKVTIEIVKKKLYRYYF